MYVVAAASEKQYNNFLELYQRIGKVGKPKAGHFFHMILPSRDDMAAFYSTSASFFRGHSATTYHIHGTMS